MTRLRRIAVNAIFWSVFLILAIFAPNSWNNILGMTYAEKIWDKVLFETPQSFGNRLIEYREKTFLEAVKRDNICTVVVVGALWDNWFYTWAKNGNWLQVLDAIESKGMSSQIEFSYMLYHSHYDEKVPIMDRLPPFEGAWGEQVGSYVIRMFKGNKVIRNIELEDKLRSISGKLDFNQAAENILASCFPLLISTSQESDSVGKLAEF